jgi:hypothetical protein
MKSDQPDPPSSGPREIDRTLVTLSIWFSLFVAAGCWMEGENPILGGLGAFVVAMIGSGCLSYLARKPWGPKRMAGGKEKGEDLE